MTPGVDVISAVDVGKPFAALFRVTGARKVLFGKSTNKMILGFIFSAEYEYMNFIKFIN